MTDLTSLRRTLQGLEGKKYGAYKQIKGDYDAGGAVLTIDYVQGDPYARPSRLRARLAADDAAIPAWARRTEARRVATADFLNRRLLDALGRESRSRGSGKSGILQILRPGQQVLRRTSMLLSPDGAVEARFGAGLPARGRRILGEEAAEMLCEAVPAAIARALRFAALDEEALRTHVETIEDAKALRSQLPEHGLVAFVAEDATLPRRSGVHDEPLSEDRVVPFEPPSELTVRLRAPNAGEVMGMGVPAGITLIVGGGYHGKSTLLRAIERGVYDHVPGDGREQVVAVDDAVKVRAEDGRQVTGTDISNFIGDLPDGSHTDAFHTTNASGSTSQAAAIAEALEAGTSCLLLDEDTSATNFMIRDARMQALIDRSAEPITPFIDSVRNLFRKRGVSTVLVVGGAGDYFDVADTVIAMDAYRPRDATADARRIADELPSDRRTEAGAWSDRRTRVPLPESIDPRRGRRSIHIRVHGRHDLVLGTEEVDVSGIEQLVEAAQTRAIARALVWARDDVLDGRRPVPDVLSGVVRVIADRGLGVIDPHPIGDYAEFRRFELAAVLNRLRSLRVRA